MEEEEAAQLLDHFVKEFPSWREEIQKCIRGIREEADAIHETHRNVTIASIATTSISAGSSVLCILGLALAPVTAGGSLALTATGIGLGAASGLAGFSAGVSEGIINYKKEGNAKKLIEKCLEQLCRVKSQIDGIYDLHRDPDEVENITVRLGSSFRSPQRIPKAAEVATELRSHVKALKAIKGNPALKALAKQASATGSKARASINGIEQIDKAFKGTAFAISKGARLMGIVAAGAGLLFDSFFIIQDAIHLRKGAKAERASEIRRKANELEKILKELTKFYQEAMETM